MEITLSIALFQVLIAFYLLITSQSKNRSKLFLYLFILTAAAHFSVKFALLQIIKDPFLFENLITSFTYLYGLLLFLYIKEFFNNNEQNKNLIHLIPFSISLLFYLGIVIYTFINYNKELLINYRKFMTFFIPFIYIFYITTTLIEIHKFKVSSPKKYNSLKNLKFIITLNLLLLLLIICFSIMYPTNPITLPIIRIISYTFIVLIIIFLVQHHYKTTTLISLPETNLETNKTKYEKYQLNPALITSYKSKLNKIMVDEKPYLNPNLTLVMLAKKIDIPKHHLSQLLNEHYHKNFYQYINEFRVKSVEEKLKIDSKTNILEIAYSCGFSTKSSFNTYFKNTTRYTPTTYRKLLLKKPKSNT